MGKTKDIATGSLLTTALLSQLRNPALKAALTLLLIVSLTLPAQVEDDPELAVAPLLRQGMTVAFIGTASNSMLASLNRAVGPRGKIIARDLTTVLAQDADPKLAVASIDVVLLINVYRMLDHPQQTLAHLRSAIKPEGRLLVIEAADVSKQIEASGFALVSKDDAPSGQSILTFARP